MIRVDEDPNHVGRGETVTTFEQFDDTIWVGVERSHEHIQIRRVVRDPRFGLEPRRLSFRRSPFLEAGDGGSSVPNLIVVLTVDHWRLIGRGRSRAAIGRRGNVRRRLRGSTISSGRGGSLLDGLKIQREGKESRGDRCGGDHTTVRPKTGESRRLSGCCSTPLGYPMFGKGWKFQRL